MTSEREKFENRIFMARFLGSIKRNPDPGPRISGAMDLVSDCPDRAELLKRDERDDYVDPYISAMWFAWRLAIDAAPDPRGLNNILADADEFKDLIDGVVKQATAGVEGDDSLMNGTVAHRASRLTCIAIMRWAAQMCQKHTSTPGKELADTINAIADQMTRG